MMLGIILQNFFPSQKMIYCKYILFFTRDLHKYIMKRFQFSLAVYVNSIVKYESQRKKMKITIISIAHIANITSYILGQYQSK